MLDEEGDALELTCRAEFASLIFGEGAGPPRFGPIWANTRTPN